MKKHLIRTLALLILPLCSRADFVDVQELLNFGNSRDAYFTTTLEALVFDPLGNTYAFIDFDHTGSDLVYLELARYFYIPGLKDREDAWKDLYLTVQYNGGNIFHENMNHVGLAGLSFWGLDVMYRQEETMGGGVQFTYVWCYNFFDDYVTFNGYTDLWKNGEQDWILYFEPQLWFNVCRYFSVGGILEITKNNPADPDWQFNPAVAVKLIYSW